MTQCAADGSRQRWAQRFGFLCAGGGGEVGLEILRGWQILLDLGVGLRTEVVEMGCFDLYGEVGTVLLSILLGGLDVAGEGLKCV